jgi:hypothetical protein
MRIGTIDKINLIVERALLHPVFGLDEDWNHAFSESLLTLLGCIQSSGWMRIGTGVDLLCGLLARETELLLSKAVPFLCIWG